MKHIEQVGARLAAPVLFGLVSLSASGQAGAHGALETEDVPDSVQSFWMHRARAYCFDIKVKNL